MLHTVAQEGPPTPQLSIRCPPAVPDGCLPPTVFRAAWLLGVSSESGASASFSEQPDGRTFPLTLHESEAENLLASYIL